MIPVRRGKIVRTIEIGGHCIYKSTLVSQLNGNFVLSKDRLARIHTIFNSTTTIIVLERDLLLDLVC